MTVIAEQDVATLSEALGQRDATLKGLEAANEMLRRERDELKGQRENTTTTISSYVNMVGDLQAEMAELKKSTAYDQATICRQAEEIEKLQATIDDLDKQKSPPILTIPDGMSEYSIKEMLKQSNPMKHIELQEIHLRDMNAIINDLGMQNNKLSAELELWRGRNKLLIRANILKAGAEKTLAELEEVERKLGLLEVEDNSNEVEDANS